MCGFFFSFFPLWGTFSFFTADAVCATLFSHLLFSYRFRPLLTDDLSASLHNCTLLYPVGNVLWPPACAHQQEERRWFGNGSHWKCLVFSMLWLPANRVCRYKCGTAWHAWKPSFTLYAGHCALFPRCFYPLFFHFLKLKTEKSYHQRFMSFVGYR